MQWAAMRRAACLPAVCWPLLLPLPLPLSPCAATGHKRAELWDASDLRRSPVDCRIHDLLVHVYKCVFQGRLHSTHVARVALQHGNKYTVGLVGGAVSAGHSGDTNMLQAWAPALLSRGTQAEGKPNVSQPSSPHLALLHRGLGGSALAPLTFRTSNTVRAAPPSTHLALLHRGLGGNVLVHPAGGVLAAVVRGVAVVHRHKLRGWLGCKRDGMLELPTSVESGRRTPPPTASGGWGARRVCTVWRGSWRVRRQLAGRTAAGLDYAQDLTSHVSTATRCKLRPLYPGSVVQGQQLQRQQLAATWRGSEGSALWMAKFGITV